MSLNVFVYDPANPKVSVGVDNSEIDVWHTETLISKSIISMNFPFLDEGELGALSVSGGMQVQVPKVKIGLKVGRIVMDNVDALVVDDGHYDLILGKKVIYRVFGSKQRESNRSDLGEAESMNDEWAAAMEEAEEYSEIDELTMDEGFSIDHDIDESCLVIELHPVEMPISSQSLELFLKNQRILHNIALASAGFIPSGFEVNKIDDFFERDEGIHEYYQLKIDSIEKGSILLSISSASKNALQYLGSILDKSTSAKLTQEMSDAIKLESEAEIARETRKKSIIAINAEKDRLSAENIHETYNIFRKEAASQLHFWDELIDNAENSDIVDILKEKKNKAILELADQNMVPVIRNIPEVLAITEDKVFNLPSPD